MEVVGMVEMSNNILAGLLLVAVVLSAFSLLSIMTIPTQLLTGAATTGTGLANVTIQSSYSIKMVRNISNFGSGTIINGQLRHLYSNSTNDGGFYNGSEGNGTDYGTGTYAYPFVVENDGNDDTTCVQVSGTAASSFIGGNSPVFEAAAAENETGSCAAGLVSAWTTVDGTADTMCQQLQMELGNDELRLHWHIGVPDDSAEGEKTNTITITALNAC
jgi:hypothetical protein